MNAHSSAHKNRFYLQYVMEYFPKGLVFWKGESSALAILLKAKGEPLPRKITYKFFSQMTPARAVRSKAEEKLFCQGWLFASFSQKSNGIFLFFFNISDR